MPWYLCIGKVKAVGPEEYRVYIRTASERDAELLFSRVPKMPQMEYVKALPASAQDVAGLEARLEALGKKVGIDAASFWYCLLPRDTPGGTMFK